MARIRMHPPSIRPQRTVTMPRRSAATAAAARRSDGFGTITRDDEDGQHDSRERQKTRRTHAGKARIGTRTAARETTTSIAMRRRGDGDGRETHRGLRSWPLCALPLLLAMAALTATPAAGGSPCAATTYNDGYVYTKENGGFAIANPGWSVSGSSFTTEVWLRNEKRGSVQCWWGQVSRNSSSSSDARCGTLPQPTSGDGPGGKRRGRGQLTPRCFADRLCCCAHCGTVRAPQESTAGFCPSA